MEQINCPKCGFSQPKDRYCAKCGLDIYNLQSSLTHKTKSFLIKNPIQITLFSTLILFIGLWTFTPKKNKAEDKSSSVSFSSQEKKISHPQPISKPTPKQTLTHTKTQRKKEIPLKRKAIQPSPPPVTTAKEKKKKKTPLIFKATLVVSEIDASYAKTLGLGTINPFNDNATWKQTLNSLKEEERLITKQLIENLPLEKDTLISIELNPPLQLKVIDISKESLLLDIQGREVLLPLHSFFILQEESEKPTIAIWVTVGFSGG